MKIILFLICLFTTYILQASTLTKETRRILIYDDSILGCIRRGTSRVAIQQTLSSISQILSKTKYTVETITPQEILSPDSLENTDLFILPGGRDIPYTKVLNGTGNKIIKEYIQAGGSYLGLCAGAYYAGSQVQFNTKNPLYSVNQARELKLYPGIVKGPALGTYNPTTSIGVQAAEIIWQLSASDSTDILRRKTIKLYYNGGGYFVDADKKDLVEVLARYKDNGEAAIIKTQVGKGTSILSGLHFEYNPSNIKTLDKKINMTKKQLFEYEYARQHLFKIILQKLNLDVI